MMKKPLLVVTIALVIVLLVWLAFRPTTIEVEIARVERGPLRAFVVEEGTTRVRERYVVSAPVTGRLQRVELDPGDRVEVGAPLFHILPAPSTPLDARTAAELRERVRAAEAGLQAAMAASSFADAELERVRALVAQGALAARDLEAADAEAETARRRVQEARATVDALRAQLETSGDRVGVAFTVHAPVEGSVLRLFRESEGVVAAGTPILEIGNLRKLEVVTDLLSEDAARVEVGAEVLLERWGGDEALRGRVRRVDPSGYTKISALGVEEQRVDVIVDLDDPPTVLGDGYRVITRIVTFSEDDVVQVPKGALFRTGTTWSAFRVEDGRARLQPVVIGVRGEERVQILDGLQPGDEVVLYPGDRIDDGTRIRAE